MPRVLVLGGVDPSGGAGLAVDARMVHARGGVPMLVPSCLTVQNRRGMRSAEPVDAALLDAMLGAAVDDGAPDAIKLGMLWDGATAATVARAIASIPPPRPPVVVDPVLSVTAGGWNGNAALVDVYVHELLPVTRVVTPNLPELELLANGDPARILEAGCGAVLVTGGHAEGDVVEDVLWTGGEATRFRHPRIPAGELHGTGCALAAALATGLGAGLDLADACDGALAAVERCIRATEPAADGEVRPLVIV